MELLLKELTPEDVAAVTRLNQRCFSRPWSESSLLAETAKSDAVFLVARTAQGEVCGYAGFNYVLDEGYIANIAVHPDFRRQGVGRRLLEALIQRAAALGLSFLTLEVRASNLPAQGLYTQLGFAPAGLRKNFYEAIREDAIIMTKYL